MFTLVRNYRTLLRMCAYSSALDGNGDGQLSMEEVDADQNGLSVEEFTKMLEEIDVKNGTLDIDPDHKAEIMQASLEGAGQLLEGFTDLSSATRQQIRVLQFMSKMVLKSQSKDVKNRDPDGFSGSNTRADMGTLVGRELSSDADVKKEDAALILQMYRGIAGAASVAPTSRTDAAADALAAAEKEDERTDVHAAHAERELREAEETLETEKEEHAALESELSGKDAVLESAGKNLESARGRLEGHTAALEAARLALEEAQKDSGTETLELKAARDARDLAQKAVDAQLKEVESITSEIQTLQVQFNDAEISYATADANAHRELTESEAAQTALDDLAYTGNLDALPSLESAKQTAIDLRAAATDLREKATAADTLYQSYSHGLFGRKSTWEKAMKAATDAESAADEAELLVKVVEAKAKLDTESGQADSAADHLQAVQDRFTDLRAKLEASKQSLTDTQSKLTAAEGVLTGKKDVVTTESGEATDAMNALATAKAALEKAETDSQDTTTAIEALEKVIARVTPERDALVTKFEDAEKELKDAEAALRDIEGKEESARVGAARADKALGDATDELDAAVEEKEYNEYYSPEHALAAMEAVRKERGRGAIKAIQQALIDAGADLGSTGADGAPGTKTKAAVEAHPDVALKALAAYIDTTDDASTETRLTKERPADGDAIDDAITAWQQATPEEKARYVSTIASEFTGEGIDANRRNVNAQYIALKLQTLGLEDNPEAGRLMEQIMAEGKGHYENESNELNIREALIDGSGRFARHLGSFPENFTGSYYKIRQTLQGAGGRSRVENGMEQGMEGTADSILKELFGVNADFVASRMHVVTGQGRDGDADMSLELGGGILLENAYYDEASGAIYATVAKGNGCEGNLVVIPVETFVPPKPRPVPVRVPRTSTPSTPVTTEDKPEETEEPTTSTYTRSVCKSDGFIHILTYQRVAGWGTLNDTLISDVKTAETCNPNPDPDPDPDPDPSGDVSTSPGVEGGGDEGGGGKGGGNDGGRG